MPCVTLTEKNLKLQIHQKCVCVLAAAANAFLVYLELREHVWWLRMWLFLNVLYVTM